jgi:hypothetical protein
MLEESGVNKLATLARAQAPSTQSPRLSRMSNSPEHPDHPDHPEQDLLHRHAI